jgi:beta-phosphoglucomutase
MPDSSSGGLPEATAGGGLPGAIAAVVFDMDGVLADTIEQHYQSWQRIADEIGVDFDRASYEQILGRNREDSMDYLLAGRQVAPAERAALLQRKNDYYLELLADMQPSDMLPGVKSLLQELRDENIPMAVGSSSKNVAIILKKLGISHCFQQVADGSSVEKAKPHPDVFLKAAALLGVPPEQCLVVEDAAAGVEAGLSAGMKVLGVGSQERLGKADLVVGSLAELSWPELVARLAA